ncbi:transposase, partial [Mycobacterium avium]
NQRNGSRPRTLSTIAGDLELRIPKLRSGSFFPALLERRRR